MDTETWTRRHGHGHKRVSERTDTYIHEPNTLRYVNVQMDVECQNGRVHVCELASVCVQLLPLLLPLLLFAAPVYSPLKYIYIC